MALRPIDVHGLRIPRESGLPLCLYVAIAARDLTSIEMFVGKIVKELGGRGSERKALLIETQEPDEADSRLAIWSVPESTRETPNQHRHRRLFFRYGIARGACGDAS